MADAVKRYRYFAYGSNMLQARLEERVGKVKKVGKGSIENFELQFNCGHRGALSYANIVFKPGTKVSGVIYLLTLRQIRELDRYEALYNKRLLHVNGNEVITYVSYMNYKDGFAPPTLPYIGLLLAGYRENNMEKSYQKLRDKIKNLFGIWVDL